MRTTTNRISSTTLSASSLPITMNSPSKTMTMLTRIRQQQEPKSVSPIQSEDENDDASTIQNIFNNKNSEHNTNALINNDQQIDLFTPLSYDEADEDQLVEFFFNRRHRCLFRRI
mmetsp:Transcript_21007/g.52106  ORF Transcript_21007/g.52106 Transcript_21007/m.52106 type:complete len:115 (+) Transcript_21007:61-405(+)